MAYGQGEGKYNYYKDFDGISSNDDYAYGSSQFVSLEDIIDYFMVAYVGEDKIIKRIKKHEVNFHAKRNLAELSFDTFKSFHAQEMVLGASLSMPLPHDYVNYTKIAWSDDSGIEHIIYPTNKTSNPLSILQDSDGGYGIKEKVSYTAGSTTATISSVNKNIKTTQSRLDRIKEKAVHDSKQKKKRPSWRAQPNEYLAWRENMRNMKIR